MEHSDEKVSDAIAGSWVYTLVSKKYWPYAQLARWERPIGWWLLLWPCWWSLALGFASNYDSKAVFSGAEGSLLIPLTQFCFYLILFLIGAVAMRGAGCTYNDIVDKDIDDKITRTRSRPIPSGRVTKEQAKNFLILQALVGFIVLIQFNWITMVLGVVSLVTVAIYPFMKRVTWWPQLFLGLAFSWGAWMGWSALTDTISAVPALLYLGCIFWVIGYDTIYAHQDIEDDALVGVKSTARLFEDRTKLALGVLYCLALCSWYLAFSALDSPNSFMALPSLIYLATLIAVACHMIWQIVLFKERDGERGIMLFKSNSNLGWIMFTGLVLAAITS